MRQLLTLLPLLFLVAPILAAERMVVVHSQSSTAPTCDSLNSGTYARWTEVWRGYSLFGFYLNNGYRSSQDLSKPGSCQEKFHPLPFIQCTKDNCQYGGSLESISIWLAVNNHGDTASLDTDHSNAYAGVAAIASGHISRCVVCEGVSPVITKHSFSTAEASCPSGWHLLWKGKSFGAASRNRSGYDAGQQLGETGSCLRHFDPNPTVQCRKDRCDKNYLSESKQMWLLNMDTQTNEALTSNSTVANRTLNEARVSKCAVCAKY